MREAVKSTFMVVGTGAGEWTFFKVALGGSYDALQDLLPLLQALFSLSLLCYLDLQHTVKMGSEPPSYC